MLFPSIDFAIFLSVVLAVAWTLHATRHEELRKWFLLLASLSFYAFWNVYFALMLVAVSAVAYTVARATASTADPRQKRWARHAGDRAS